MAAKHGRQILNRAQQEALAEMLGDVFIYLRAPGYQYFWDRQEDWYDLAKVQAAVDRSVAMAEAMHNIPRFLLRDEFDFSLHKKIFSIYAEEYPDMARYVTRLEEIEAMGGWGGDRGNPYRCLH